MLALNFITIYHGLSILFSMLVRLAMHTYTMKMIVWNCRGAAMPSFANYVKTLLGQHNVDVMCFLETHLDESSVNWIRKFFDQA